MVWKEDVLDEDEMVHCSGCYVKYYPTEARNAWSLLFRIRIVIVISAQTAKVLFMEPVPQLAWPETSIFIML